MFSLSCQGPARNGPRSNRPAGLDAWSHFPRRTGIHGGGKCSIKDFPHLVPLTMSTTSKPPSLAELRADIDRIDAEMHRLLMERGDIIGRLIKVKRTSESGSAFRPAREADMMRRLVQRHHGIL